MKRNIYCRIAKELEDIPLNEKGNIFNIIIQQNNNENKASWSDIMELVLHYYAFNPDVDQRITTKHLYTDEYKKYFECLGININYIDDFKENLLQYLLRAKSRDIHMRVGDELIDYLIENTENIYNVNHFNQNILFYIMGLHESYSDHSFFKILKKYPNFDLHLNDNSNTNLLHHALNDSGTPKEIISYLIENNIDHTQINTFNGQTILFPFISLGCSKHNKEFFDKFLLDIDITHQDNFKDNVLGQLLFWIKNANTANVKRYEDWIEHISEKIIQGHFYHTKKTIEKLHTIVSGDLTGVSSNLYSTLDKVKTYLADKLLDNNIPLSENKKKIKM